MTHYLFILLLQVIAYQPISKPAKLAITPNVAWEFETKEDTLGNPQTKIYLKVNGKKHYITNGVGNFDELSKESFKQKAFQIPDKALSACTGFWAGLGHTLYVVSKKNTLIVMEGYLEELSPENTNIKYRAIKKIKF